MTHSADPSLDPSRWGPTDERGALNLQTPGSVLRSLRSARTGRVFELGLPLQKSGQPHVAYRPTPQRFTLMNQTDEESLVLYGGTPGTGSHEDVVMMPTHEATHMDALGHVYQAGAMYNGFPHDATTSQGGLKHLGIDKAGPIVAQAVMLDVARHLGPLEPGYVITVADLQLCLDRDGLTIPAASVPVVRTGWLGDFDPDGDMPMDQPGIGLAAAQFLADHDVIAVGADNTALEAMPFDGGDFMPVHIELLTIRGVYILEHLVLDELSAEGVREFVLICSPLAFTGASGCPVNPIAIA